MASRIAYNSLFLPAFTAPFKPSLLNHSLVSLKGYSSSPKISMSLRAGIVGLPNVGKSTLFNSVVENGKAQAANFPFCTIEPNVGIVAVPDPRLQVLSDLSKSQKAVPASIEFVDIAGLVKGASQGEGLGNKFLSHIREVDSILQVVRCFEDNDIIHVSGKVDPKSDIDVINLELIFSDMEQIEKRLERLKKSKAKDSQSKVKDEAEKSALEKIHPALLDGKPARSVALTDFEKESVKHLCLLTMKPVIYVGNVAESDLADAGSNPHVQEVMSLMSELKSELVTISAQVESELTELPFDERTEYLKSLGVSESGFGNLIRATYNLLGLHTYFTSGEKETKAWTIHAGMTAPQAAGVIHSDFEKGFIRAETVAYDDFVAAGSLAAARERGVYCFRIFNKVNICLLVLDLRSLKTQNLPGILPPEAVKLPYLQVFNFDRDLLSHSIPPEWGSWTKLINMSLLANRLTGSLPKELANISTLSSITVEYNQLSGNLSPELGYMPSIQRFLLSSNFFTGKIPATFAKLTTLIDFRIPDNRFTGNIPEFIGKWTNLTRLEIRGSGLSGPIPQGIAALTNMTNLKISDLNGSPQPFPPISNLKNLKILILRNCNIIGELPDYISGFTSLNVLDLSFNYLTGRIPFSYASLTKVKYMYLTGNSLSGTIPDWMFSAKGNIDLSYNNLTLTSNVSSCQQGNVNLFASSVGSHSKGIAPCLSSLQCPKKYSGFHINCGGKEFNDGSITYEEDMDAAGPANFYHRNGTNWAFSSTGHFIDGIATYITTNTSQLATGTSQLYLDARLSPLSLTYYGFCLENGKYMVDLHFAEITFTHDRTYTSLGRRIFDVYIQGKLVLKDFNIAAAARGAGKRIIKSLTAAVDNSTLEIRFYWAGKGTNAIPVKGVYGPLVSAISVKPTTS